MKVLVLGSKGQLGRCLYDQLEKTNYEVFYTSRAEFDLSDLDSITENLSLIRPTIVINASAYTAVDKAEDDHETADLINHLAVAKLADACNGLNVWLVHVSTDYVFDGTATKPYREDDETNPQSIYGKSKLNGELAITRSGCNHIIIRTAWVFSEYGNNFFKTMLRLGSDRDELSIVNDQLGCPTYAQDIAKVITCMLPDLFRERVDSGIFHYCGDQPCSWYAFAIAIFSEARADGRKVPDTLLKATSLEFKSLAERPLYSVLDCSKIKAVFNIESSDWANGIVSVIKKL
jgi:dTDP-4-dehydrorhamnose reductase